MKYRKKPVVIEAVQLSWKTWCELCDVFPGLVSPANPARNSDTFVDDCGEVGPYIELTCMTLNGPVVVKHGEWIIRGVQGEVYPCMPDIFALTYELVEG